MTSYVMNKTGIQFARNSPKWSKSTLRIHSLRRALNCTLNDDSDSHKLTCHSLHVCEKSDGSKSCKFANMNMKWPKSGLSNVIPFMTKLQKQILHHHMHTLSRKHYGYSGLVSHGPYSPGVQLLSCRHFSVQSFVESVVSTQAGIFRALSESSAVEYGQKAFQYVHDTTYLPWWGSIVLTTLLLRAVITLPLALYQNYILAKVENLQFEMQDIVKELKRETAIAIKKFNWTEKTARSMYNRSLKKQWSNLLVRENCHPFKASILLWVQLPMWITLSMALRNMAYMLPHKDVAAEVILLELSVGGFLWIPNLVVPDVSLILPVMLGVVNLAIVELQVLSKAREPSKMQSYATNFFRVLSVVMIPIAASVPSCLCLYWVTSSMYGLTQNLLLLSPSLRRMAKIPVAPSELAHPYQHVLKKLQDRLGKITPKSSS